MNRLGHPWPVVLADKPACIAALALLSPKIDDISVKDVVYLDINKVAICHPDGQPVFLAEPSTWFVAPNALHPYIIQRPNSRIRSREFKLT
jgi:hypothetical protein